MAKWKPPETAPRNGDVFRITTAGPNQDLCYFDKEAGQFKDYFHRQVIRPEWPSMVAWKKLGRPAKVCNTEAASRRKNGWDGWRG